MKRLIICADGTWDTPDLIDTSDASAAQEQKILSKHPVREPSNVVKMARAIKPTAEDKTQQVVYYDQGVGTGMGFYDKFIGGGFGVGLSYNILDCYRFLVDNYDDGDELFLFGFSRGAFTVRSLAGMLHHCGLLTKDDAYYIPEAYEHYLLEDNDPAILAFREGTKFRKRNHPTRDINIKFIGVWDTVGALGLPFHGPLARRVNQKYSFHDVTLGENVEFAYQALAIDEWRAPFEASVWNPVQPPPPHQTIEQKWFIGSHCNVGGTVKANRLRGADGKFHSYRLESYAFRWMVEKATAKAVGLEFDQQYVAHFNGRPECSIRPTWTGIYKLWPKYLRPIGATQFGNESIHESVMERMAADPAYRPANLMSFLNK